MSVSVHQDHIVDISTKAARLPAWWTRDYGAKAAADEYSSSMAAISQFTVLSPRGDSIISKEVRCRAPTPAMAAPGCAAALPAAHPPAPDAQLDFTAVALLLLLCSRAVASARAPSRARALSRRPPCARLSTPRAHAHAYLSLPLPQFRGDVPKGVSEIFFRAVKFWKGGKGDPPPIFNVDGVNFLYTKKNGIYFMATTKFNVSPSFVLELLDRIARVFKDYCGVLTEESIRKNFVLLYELLDEMVDYGYPQSTSTETLKLYVHNEPVAVERAAAAAAGGGMLASRRTISSSAVQRPISLMASGGGGGGEKKNEIYVDILERLTVLFNSNGYVLNSTIDGCIQMKSYLQGNPGLRFALNEDLVVGKENAQHGGGGYGAGPALVLDDCNFHECVNLDDFEGGRTLALIPPDGEFVVMNYRITSEFRAPFRIFPALEEQSQYKLELVLRVRADVPEKVHGANVVIRFPVPKTATTVIPEIGVDGAPPGGAGGGGGGGGLGSGAAARSSAASSAAAAAAVGQTAEYDSKERQVVWVIKKFVGGTEQTLRTRITLGAPSSSTLRKELGPISMNFEIPMHNVSNLQVKYLKIAEAASTKANRWVRYVTTSNSYVCRL